MSGIRLGMRWSGLEVLAAGLGSLPDRVQQRAEGIVNEAAMEHFAAVRPKFPERSVTGNLARALAIERTGPLTRRVVNRAPHSHLYEFGYTHIANGKQIAGHDVYVPEAQDIRARMISRLEQLVGDEASRSGALQASGVASSPYGG